VVQVNQMIYLYNYIGGLKMILEWRQLIKYPDLIPAMSDEVKGLLDSMQELVPIFDKGNRLDSFLEWKRNCIELEVITPRDESLIINEMIHGCGGM